MAIIQFKQLREIRERHKDNVLVFSSGSFDLTHAGHALFLEDCKMQGDVLIVAIGSDKETAVYKDPSRPILNQHLRLKMIDSLKPVDYSLIGPSRRDQNIWWTPIEDVFVALKPDIYVINDDARDIPDRERLVKKYGIKMVTLPRSHPPEFGDLSTTAIIERIQKSKPKS